MTKSRCEFVLPDLGLGEHSVRASVWLISPGNKVVVGDRLIEVAAADVTIDLPAPVTGRLVEQCVDEDDELEAGQRLGWIAPDAH